MPFLPSEWPALNQWEDLLADVVRLLQIKMDISFASNVVYQHFSTLSFKMYNDAPPLPPSLSGELCCGVWWP